MVTTKEETITPAIAKKMLEHNVSNRPVNETNVNFLAKQMKNDEFHLTGETIKFSKEERLLDGQHRLLAVIKSGVTIKTLVTRGLEEEVFKFIDTGRKRGAGDVLAMDGVENYNNIAAMIKFISMFKAGRFSDAAHMTGAKAAGLSNYDIIEFYNKHAQSLQASFITANRAKSKLVNGSQLAGWHFIFKKFSEADADEFIARLGDGVNLGIKSPIYVLREKLMSDKVSQMKLTPYTKTAFIVKSWNHFRAKKSVSLLKFDATREDFPKPI